MKTLVVLSLALSASTVLLGADRIKVKIVDRRNSEQTYGYTIPAKLQATSQTDGLGTTHITGTITPSREVSYSVRGATFTLRLPDDRLVIVNCDSKTDNGAVASLSDFVGGMKGQTQAKTRSCRMPLVDDIDAEFNKDKAKLFWPVSLDGKKIESETYKILGIMK